MDNRNKLIYRASIVSTVGNAILAFSKIGVGFYAGSLAVIGDGIDSSVDIIMSVITIITAKIMSRPPDKKYAYGYEKADSMAAKMLSFLIFFAGIQLGYSTIKRMFSPGEHEIPDMIACYVIIFSIAGKLFLSLYQLHIGKKTKSNMLIANAKNMRYDVGISMTVLFGLLSSKVFNFPLADPIAALIISIWVIKGAIEIFRESSIELMDGVKDPSIYNKIFEAASEVKGVANPHRVRSRQIGNMHMIVIDIEVDGNMPLYKAHEIAHQVDRQIRLKIEDVYDIVVHVEPIGNIEEGEKTGVCVD